MISLIDDLIALSHYAAEHPRFVQGGGGNCSVKTPEIMAIKASGFFLEEVTKESGYCFIDLASDAVSGPSAKPSLETPLHKLLGRCVIHTHAIAAGAFLCAEEGRAALSKALGETRHHWIPYADPGQSIYKLMRTYLAEKELDPRRELVLFLENHGIFISAGDRDECIAIHEKVTSSLEEYLGGISEGAAIHKESRYLTPDHAVYLNLGGADLSHKQRTAAEELQMFTGQVLALIGRMGWTPRFLPQETAERLLNMEEEKYRQRILREGKQ